MASRSRASMACAAVATALVLALPGDAAAAPFAVDGFTVAPTLVRGTPAATPATQAAGHPDVEVGLDFPDATRFDPPPAVDDISLHLPAGLIGNPRATPRCSQQQFLELAGCPTSTQVGTVAVTAVIFVPIPLPGAVYNLEPEPGEPARLGVSIAGLVKVLSPVTLRASDGGLDATITDLPDIHLNDMTLMLWGADAPGRELTAPFITLPTSCAPAQARVEAAAADATARVEAVSTFTPTGCEAVPFAPGAALATSTTRRGTPSAYGITLTVPATEDPLRQAHVKRADVVLPEGTALSPGVTTSGLDPCTDEQFAGAGCPEAADIGDVAFVTPLLEQPLAGQVYFAAATPTRPLGLFVDVDDGGVRLKLTGTVRPDPATGRITTTFDDLPQVPFTRFTLSFRGGPDAVLVNSRACGPQQLETRLTPHSGGADSTPAAPFAADEDGAGGACAEPAFRPALAVEIGDRTAGRPAGAVTLRIGRRDEDQPIGSLVTDLPPGLAGVLPGVGLCPDAGAATGECPEDSRVGGVTAVVGGGTAPVTLRGAVFLTGPAEGGLAGLAIVIPGKVGPIELGTVVARAGIQLRPADGGLTVRTGELPRIVGGVPIAIRELALTLDRPGFMRNATACEPLAVGASFTSVDGVTATASAPYRAERCDELAFAPRISATVGGRGRTGSNRRPALRTVITVPAGHAATRSVAVTLPTGVGVDLARLGVRCAPAQAETGACPAASRIGAARARTSLLPVPLTGDVFLSDTGPGLPGLLVRFTSPVALSLNGSVDFTPQGLRSTFSAVPDVPLERFELTLFGGRAGALTLGAGSDLCRGAAPGVSAAFTAHSGATASHAEAATVAGCGPRATLRLGRLGITRPSLALTVRQIAGGEPLRRVRLRLPTSLHASGARARRDGVGAWGDGTALQGSLSRSGTLTVRSPAGARAITARLGRGAFRASAALRRRLRRTPSLTFRVETTDAAGVTTRTTVRLRAKR